DATAGLDLANAPFIGAFEKAWNNDDVFITGTTVLFKTTNFFSGASVTWFTNSPDIGAGIGAYAFAKSDLANTTYAFGASGGALRLTTNGGGSWVNIDAANQVPNRTIGDLAFNPTNANILYVCVAGTSGGAPANVYRTTNALAASPTWGNLSYPVDVSANTIVLDGEDPNIVYVGTDIGIWKSANGGTNWTHMGPEVGMPNVEVDELSLQNGPSRLMAFTHGRGAFLLVLANSANLALSQTASANPTSVGCDVTFTLIAVNSGIVGATGVWVTNRMPAGTSFISASTSQGSFALNGQDVVFNLGSLPITSNATMTVTVNPPGAGSLTNTATVRADQPDPDLLNNSATRVVAAFVDSGPPTLVSATASADGQTIQLAFSESVAADMATNTANYAITNGRGNTLPVTAARFGAGSSIVLLTVNVLEGLAPFVVRVSNVADCRGNTLAPGSEVIVSLPAFDLIALGAVWKYLDDGSNQGMAWRARAFNDSTWAAGPAQLGYGDGDEMTIISYGPNANAKYTTYYFRRAFVLPDASAFTNLVVSLQRDDGGIVYLNGVEIFRSNMTTGAVTSATFAATTASDDGTVFFSTNASPSLLLDGTNVVAVEIHQSNAASTDVSFDLELTGLLGPVRPPVILNEPQSTIVVAGSNATLSVLASGSSPLAYQWQHNGTNLLVASNATLTLTSVTTNQSGDYAVVVTNFAGSVTSAIATVLVAVRPVITQQPTPTNVTVVAGSSVSFTLSASGTLPMSYRWRRNGNNITNFILNANTCVFTIPIARTNDAGNYTVGVTNAAGAAPISGTAVLNVLADSDGDGMPDVFEAAFAGNFTNSHGQVVPGLSSTNAADAAIDSDGDGLTNLQEYIAGTNPHDDQSYLKVTEITSALGVITLQFPAVSNRTYSVIYRNFITNGVWSMLTNVLSRSTNRIETIYDPGPASDGRMYRLATPHAP
ncbi:MAG TPA: immunoglobulin domain-containing protein, partial [Verrucomicrobiae bacterium]